VPKRRNEKMDCIFGTPKQQNEDVIKKSDGPNCLKVDEKEGVSTADDEDGKPETRFSLKDIVGRVTFVEIIFNFSCVLFFEVRWDEDVKE
jgi:hypothetical protein